MRSRLQSKMHLAFAVGLTLAAAGAFYGPALRATHGDWPAPLDDVFIHYDFARAAVRGHPFEWIAGQGYSSGETAPLYALVLALGYAVGFRGLWLGAWAAIVACASLVAMMRGLSVLLRPAPPWVAWIGAVLLVSVGMLDWTWFSGMETALLGAVLMGALVATKRAREAAPTVRRRAQWATGGWGAALVLLRPEAALVTFTMGVAVARRARSQSARGALFRVWAPGATALVTLLGANRAFTGEAESAGALLKLLSQNPFLTDVDRARSFAMNLAMAYWKVLEAGLSSRAALVPLLPALVVVAILAPRTRALAAICMASALGWALLVSCNGAAPFQNFRYYMPALLLSLVASALGLGALSARRAGGIVGALLASAAVLLGAPRLGAQIAFFRDASANVHDQQVEVGRRIARTTPLDASVLVGDAGAIAYVSGRHAIDALGLGGYRRMPFVGAAVLGEAATVELIERLPPEDRPGYMALYPNWFGGITSRFGREIDRVSIVHNVICGGPTKVIYLADWSSLGRADDAIEAPERDVVDSLDVADVVSEKEHAYLSPAPDGGWTLLDVRVDESGARRFDAGRVTPEGRSERFVVAHASHGPVALAVRTDGEESDVEVTLERPTGPRERTWLSHDHATADRWAMRRAAFEGGALRGDTIVLTATRGVLRDFHVWLTNEDGTSAQPFARRGRGH